MTPTGREIKEIVQNTFPGPRTAALEGDTSLRELGLDSLDLANLFLAIEEKFDLKIPDDAFKELDSVNTIAGYVDGQRHNGR